MFSGFGFYFVRFRFLLNCGIIRVSVLIFSGFSSYLGGVFVSFGSYFTRFGSYSARVRLGLGWGWARLVGREPGESGGHYLYGKALLG